MQEDKGMTDRKGRWTDEMEEKVRMREAKKGKGERKEKRFAFTMDLNLS